MTIAENKTYEQSLISIFGANEEEIKVALSEMKKRKERTNMTAEDAKLWYEGKDLWFEYTRVNGYSFTFKEAGITKLAHLLDLKPAYIKKRICLYLDN
jgi:hypothetical protein